MLNVRIKKLSKDAVIPSYAHKGDSGMDIYSIEDKIINPREFELISTGIALSIPYGYEAQVRPKSGLAAKNGITILNTPGTIDCHYRGEIMVICINLGKSPYNVEKGKKIAQIVFNKVEEAEFEEALELDDTTRGSRGFGSTGV